MALELDHTFVRASPGAPEMAALVKEGFLEGPDHDHPGQGTASRGVFFDNAYLELIWLTDPAVARGRGIRGTRLADRLEPARSACPLGFGLRAPHAPVPAPPFVTWRYAPPYLPEGASFAMGANAADPREPLLFVLPWARTPSWPTPRHPNGARRLTGVTLVCPPPGSRELRAFLEMGLVGWEEGRDHLLRLELDGGSRGGELDARPGLPLVIRW